MTTKISTLPTLATVTDATIIPVVESGTTKKITGAALKTYTGTALGPQGPSGPSGPSGPAGSNGSSGSTGVTGPQGPSGPSGPSGAAGSAGASGPQGPSGPNGAAGSNGASGPSGPSGPGTLNSGTAGYVPYYSGTTTLSAPTSGNLFWDNTNGRLGIGTTSPLGTLQIGSIAQTSGQNDLYLVGDRTNASGYFSRLMFKNSTQASGSSASIRGERDVNNYGTMLTFYTQPSSAAGDGSERVRIDSNGTIGVNETSPGTYAKFLTVRGAPGDTSLPSVYISRDNNAGGGAGNDEIALQIKIDGSYNGAGGIYPIKTYARHNLGQTAYGGYFEAAPNNSSNYAGVYAKTTQGDTNGYNTPKGVFADVYNSNDVGHGYAFGVYSQTSNYSLHVPYAANIQYSGSNTVTVFYLQRNGGTPGSITCTASATAYNTSSDYRLKENVANITTGLADVNRMRPVNFTWKKDGTAGIGFIAHELQEVVPQAVHGVKDAVTKTADLDENGNSKLDENGEQLLKTVPVYQGVDSSFLVATLTAAVQELSAKLDSALARIAQLEGN